MQNLYNLTNRQAEDLLEHCEREQIGFIPWFPLATGKLSEPGGPLDEISKRSGHSPSQLALAWLLKRSPVMLPIPGTSSVAHLEENTAAAEVELSDEHFEELAQAAGLSYRLPERARPRSKDRGLVPWLREERWFWPTRPRPVRPLSRRRRCRSRSRSSPCAA